MIPRMQGPIYPGGLSVCKSELGLGRNVRMPAAHRSGTSIVQNRIGRVVLRVDDRRHQLCCQAVICCDGQIVF